MRWLAAIVLLLALAGCGRVTQVREGDVIVPGSEHTPSAAPDRQTRGAVRIATARIVFVTHGQASDQFWAVVKRGITDAQRQTGAVVSYRAPDRFSIERMRRFIDEAAGDHPDGLVVSLPDATALSPSVRAAVRAGVPVVTINSGSSEFKRLGVLAHVGQPEYEAGVQAGERMARAGVRQALCINQEGGNIGLDQRCRGLADGLAEHGGHSRVLPVPLQNAEASQGAIAEAIATAPIDGILALGRSGAVSALDAVRASGLASRITLASFDLSPEVLAAVRDGKMLFAVDQQPYLQGYLPVIMLAQRARFGVFPSRGRLISTGPNFVTKATAPEVIRLSAEGLR
jgi:simple sugar transport system substrate-binding protein